MEIPAYPAARPIDLQDKPFLDSTFLHLAPKISEFTFANLYLFRHAHAYALTSVSGIPVVLGCGYGGESYFLPPLSEDPVPALLLLLEEGMMLYGAGEIFCRRFLADAIYEVAEDRDNFDYVYRRTDLADLAGNRFHKKKNRLNYLMRRHEVVAERFADNHIAECFDVLAEWERVRAAEEDRSVFHEVAAAGEALRLWRELALEGVVSRVDGTIKGFSLGERLNADTAVCHFEKADLFFEGLPQYLNREFARTVFTDCPFINREQDLGESGLREAKLSYHPAELVRKFRVRMSPDATRR